MSNSGYGWYLRHRRSDGYVRVDDVVASRCSVVLEPAAADQFATRDQALDVLDYLQQGTSTFPPCDVVDATIPSPVPDKDRLVLKSFEEIIAEARARSAAERAARGHLGGNQELRHGPPPAEQPPRPPGPIAYGVGGFGMPSRPLFSRGRQASHHESSTVFSAAQSAKETNHS